MTTVSLDAQRAIYAQETGDYPIILLTITHRDLKEEILLSTDPTTRLSYTNDETVVYGTVHNSKEYIYCPMEISWISEDEEAAPQTQLSVSNVDRIMVETIRSLKFSPSVSMIMVLASNTDSVEMSISGLKFSEVDINEMTISGTLTLETMVNEPFPYRTFTPSTASGLFKS